MKSKIEVLVYENCTKDKNQTHTKGENKNWSDW